MTIFLSIIIIIKNKKYNLNEFLYYYKMNFFQEYFNNKDYYREFNTSLENSLNVYCKGCDEFVTFTDYDLERCVCNVWCYDEKCICHNCYHDELTTCTELVKNLLNFNYTILEEVYIKEEIRRAYDYLHVFKVRINFGDKFLFGFVTGTIIYEDKDEFTAFKVYRTRVNYGVILFDSIEELEKYNYEELEQYFPIYEGIDEYLEWRENKNRN